MIVIVATAAVLIMLVVMGMVVVFMVVIVVTATVLGVKRRGQACGDGLGHVTSTATAATSPTMLSAIFTEPKPPTKSVPN